MINLELKLKQIRLDNDFTQLVVAQKLGVSRVVYNRYENGNRSVPIEILWALADLYDVSIDVLVGREEYIYK